MKSHWWVDANDKESDNNHPASYLDIACHPLKLVIVSLSHAQT